MHNNFGALLALVNGLGQFLHYSIVYVRDTKHTQDSELHIHRLGNSIDYFSTYLGTQPPSQSIQNEFNKQLEELQCCSAH